MGPDQDINLVDKDTVGEVDAKEDPQKHQALVRPEPKHDDDDQD